MNAPVLDQALAQARLLIGAQGGVTPPERTKYSDRGRTFYRVSAPEWRRLLNETLPRVNLFLVAEDEQLVDNVLDVTFSLTHVVCGDTRKLRRAVPLPPAPSRALAAQWAHTRAVCSVARTLLWQWDDEDREEDEEPQEEPREARPTPKGEWKHTQGKEAPPKFRKKSDGPLTFPQQDAPIEAVLELEPGDGLPPSQPAEVATGSVRDLEVSHSESPHRQGRGEQLSGQTTEATPSKPAVGEPASLQQVESGLSPSSPDLTAAPGAEGHSPHSPPSALGAGLHECPARDVCVCEDAEKGTEIVGRVPVTDQDFAELAEDCARGGPLSSPASEVVQVVSQAANGVLMTVDTDALSKLLATAREPTEAELAAQRASWVDGERRIAEAERAEGRGTVTVTEDVEQVKRTSAKPCSACQVPFKKGDLAVRRGGNRLHLQCGGKKAP